MKKFRLEELSDLPDYSAVLENLKLISPQSQETLFHTRSILEGEVEGVEAEAAADEVTVSEDDFDDDFDDDFFEDEDDDEETGK
ncbi:MAG: hypothetical protein K2J16_06215 [Clostridia bacterium]|nr:hypothetical protein [Clostridia bacterium]